MQENGIEEHIEARPASAQVVVPNIQQISFLDDSFPRGRPGFDPRPGHVSPGTSRRG